MAKVQQKMNLTEAITQDFKAADALLQIVINTPEILVLVVQEIEKIEAIRKKAMAANKPIA